MQPIYRIKLYHGFTCYGNWVDMLYYEKLFKNNARYIEKSYNQGKNWIIVSYC